MTLNDIPDEFRRAHRHSIRNFAELRQSDLCGCFYCRALFGFEEIDRWLATENTALCPVRGIDSVIGDASGFPLTEEFLNEMHRFYFGDER